MEEWKDIVGYEGIYQISNYGNVKRVIARGSYKEGSVAQRKRFRKVIATLRKDKKDKQIDIAVTVAKYFLPTYREGYHISHIDGNIFNNNVNNLRCEEFTEKEYFKELQRGIQRKGGNSFRIFDDCVYVTLTNSKKEMICDKEDWDKLKMLSWFDSNGYAVAKTDKGYERFHRLVKDAEDDYIVDHINRNTYDNRKQNLRVTTQRVNMINTKTSKSNKLGVKGVYKRGKRYVAYLMLNRKTVWLGTYDTIEEAKLAREKGEERIFNPIIEKETLR